MTIYVAVLKSSSLRLWGLDARERLHRQLREIYKESGGKPDDLVWLDNPDEAPEKCTVFIINGHFLFEKRTLKGVLKHTNALLLQGENDGAAAIVASEALQPVLAFIKGESTQIPAGLKRIHTSDMAAFDENLRRSTIPLLEPVDAEHKQHLENKLYGNAYRGITDLVTKFVFPRPARQVVQLSAQLGLSPNMITTFGLVLVIAAGYLFLQGHYVWGLLAGWCMSFLDTVDGKLARVTVQSSKFGHLFDHAIDLIHPPFWYIFWGMSLPGFHAVLVADQAAMYWLIVIAYILGRLVEGIFPLLGNCSIFTWRPIDAWFRLVTARRNPCLIILTVSVLLARPDWGFIAVTYWSVLTTLIMLLRLFQALAVRLFTGPLHSWLEDENVASGPHAASYRIFGATRGAYVRSSGQT